MENDFKLNEDGGAGGRLNAETATKEMLDSSASVLQSNLGRTKGLQQFFTPIEASMLARTVLGNMPVIDLTAGNGGFMQAWDKEDRFGIEIDPEMTKLGAYNSITGDIQKAYPLLKRAHVNARLIVINPPFGLMWEDAAAGHMGSTKLCYHYAQELIGREYTGRGQGVLIAGADRFHREILGQGEHGNKFYCGIKCPDLFTNAKIDSVIAFFTDSEGEYEERNYDKANLTDNTVAEWVVQRRRDQFGFYRSIVSSSEARIMEGVFHAIELEYKRRYGKLNQEAKWDLSLKGNKISVGLSAYTQLTLKDTGKLRNIQMLNNQAAEYFSLNSREWTSIKSLSDNGIITVDPEMINTVEDMIVEAKRATIPLYPVLPQQRLGFMEDVEMIKCVKGDTEKGFIAGEEYEVDARSAVTSRKFTEEKLDKDNKPIEVEKIKEWRCLRITIGKTTFTEEKEDIAYIVDHFDLPDPGDVVSAFPEELDRLVKLLEGLQQQEHGTDKEWTFRQFQKEDLARLLFKRGGLLSWKQGLGKTLAGLAFAIAAAQLGADDRALFVIPQDLIPQWEAEAMRFFGRKFTIIRNIAEARECSRHFKAGGTGWYLTYYEALSRNGREFKLRETVLGSHRRRPAILKPDQFQIPDPMRGEQIWVEDNTGDERGHFETVPMDSMKTFSSDEFCPNCLEPAQFGKWNPKTGICSNDEIEDQHAKPRQTIDEHFQRVSLCGYRHIDIKVKAAYKHLTVAFRHGTIIIDEGTKMKSSDSLMSKAVRGLRADWRLLLTGTPAKNYIPDCFWLLWWALGNSSSRFPFDADGGYMKFAKEFAVVEFTLDGRGNRKSSKIRPEVANLSVLWRLLCASIIRRRKEDTGEVIVPMTVVPITCPMGEKQAKMYKAWLMGFAKFFIDKYPDKNISKFPNLVERFAAILGMQWKLEWASILPESEPDGFYDRGVNWTPAMLKVLELAKQHAEAGEKILIGSSLKALGPWVATRLVEAGIKAEHITRITRAGKLTTKSPKQRASTIKAFQEGDNNVLCTTLAAMKLGHNIDKANIVIILGMPWDYETYDQFIARVHRLTSTKPVTVYVVMADKTITERKYELVTQKGAASMIAFDADLFAPDIVEVSIQQILNELIAKGISTEGAIPEEEIEAQWYRMTGQGTGQQKELFTTEDAWTAPVEDLATASQLDMFGMFFDEENIDGDTGMLTHLDGNAESFNGDISERDNAIKSTGQNNGGDRCMQRESELGKEKIDAVPQGRTEVKNTSAIEGLGNRSMHDGLGDKGDLSISGTVSPKGETPESIWGEPVSTYISLQAVEDGIV